MILHQLQQSRQVSTQLQHFNGGGCGKGGGGCGEYGGGGGGHAGGGGDMVVEVVMDVVNVVVVEECEKDKGEAKVKGKGC